jgi:mono/diheme cytochrome c family protein
MRLLGGRVLRVFILGTSCIVAAASAAACSSESSNERTASEQTALNPSPVPVPVPPTAALQHGQNVWLKATFGGEIFFSLLLPQPPFNLPLGIPNVLFTPRSQRFTQWGVINDPGCELGTDPLGLDVCTPDVDPSDPDAPYEGEPSGVVGIRKFPNPVFVKTNPVSPTNFPYIFGVACAGCHAGFEPTDPPADPNHPTWNNISLTIGNQFLRAGGIFDANLADADPRWQVFNTWAPGTVDTTAIENDGINNNGIITQFFDFPDRPFFPVHSSLVDLTMYGDGNPPTAHRAGQGGEDDVGCQLAATRVYFNIGMCALQCMLPHLGTNPPSTQTPISLSECASLCAPGSNPPPYQQLPYFAQQQADSVDECAFFMNAKMTPVPHLEDAPGGRGYIDRSVVRKGARVFREYCAGCHSNGERVPDRHNVYSDDLLHEASGYQPFIGEPPGEIGTNKCRSLTTNWSDGHIWAEFSSDFKRELGPGFYRDVPLLAIWATAPFLHNNRLGDEAAGPDVASRVAAFEKSYDLLVNPFKRDQLGSIQRTTVPITLTVGGIQITLPAGTPVDLFANLDPQTLTLRCPDLVENGGHYFGALLCDRDKYALREFLKTL